MKLYFGGGEVPGWRRILAGAEVPAVSLSFVGLSRRVKKLGGPWLADKFPAAQEIFLDSGAYSLNKEGADYSDEDALALATMYMAFAADNIDRIAMVSEFDALQLGSDWREGVREDFWNELGDKFLPIWHAEDGPEELARLTSRYQRVGILQGDTDANLTPLLNAVTGLSGCLLHGVAMTRMEAMRNIGWDSVGSTSWLSPSQYGDTFVWTGKELKRYPKKYKEQARKRHRTLFTDNGFDAALIAGDDTAEVLKLSIWSWSQFVADIDRREGVTHPPISGGGGNLERDVPEVDPPVPGAGNGELVSGPRERVLLPVLTLTSAPVKDGDESGAIEARVGVTNSNLMQCSGCYMKDKCPQFRPGSECAFDIPMTLTTATQVRALRKALLAMQAQRVLMMRMIEQVEGGYADPNLSIEIGRLQRMIKDDEDSSKEGFDLHLQVTGSGNPGMISRLFGEDTAGRMAALPAPQPTSDYLAGLPILDAEVVEEDPARRAP